MANVELVNAQVVMFGRPTCPYCIAAKKTAECLLSNGRIVSFEFKDIGLKTKLQVKQTIAHNTVPQVFVNKVFIGGNSDFQLMVTNQCGGCA